MESGPSSALPAVYQGRDWIRHGPKPDFLWPPPLMSAYTDDVAGRLHMSPLEAARLIAGAESEFRDTMVFYGRVLMLPEADALQILGQQLADMAALFGVPAGAKPLVALALQAAVQICASDYKLVLDATTAQVAARLYQNNIRY